MTAPQARPSKVTRRYQILPARYTCRTCGTDITRKDLAALTDMALGHVADSGHEVTVTESSQVHYGPPQAVAP